jgi:hypothetical protein
MGIPMTDQLRLIDESEIISGPPGETCGTCAHFIRKEFNDKTYFKCEMIGDSNGTATDIRKGQTACRERKGFIRVNICEVCKYKTSSIEPSSKADNLNQGGV